MPESHRVAGFKGADMPLVRISLVEGKSAAQKQKIAGAIHRALVETIAIPAQDRFQIITEHAKPDFIYDPQYLNISRTDNLVIIARNIQVLRSEEHTSELQSR